jgi:hypothetical protein
MVNYQGSGKSIKNPLKRRGEKASTWADLV